MPDALTATLGRVCGELDRQRIPYMVIGGIAGIIWGGSRATFDIDITVSVEEPAIASAINALGAAFRILPAEPQAFVTETRVLPIEDPDTRVRVDLIFAMLPFELDAIARATEVDVGGNRIRVCTVEDLILHKVVSDRPKDLADVKDLFARHRGKIDTRYLDPRVRELSAAMDKPEILDLLR